MTSVIVEIWVWFAFVVIITLSRIAYRYKKLGGVKNFQLDDYFILPAFALYIVASVTAYFSQLTVNSISGLSNSEHVNFFHLTSAATTLYKFAIATDQAKIATVWLVKLCLLILYLRVSECLRRENIILRLILVYVVLGWVVVEVLFFAVWCRPFNDYWSNHPGQCVAPTHHFITEGVFNLTSDIAMLTVMLTITLRSSLPLRKKLWVCTVFGLGVFVIFCAAASKYIIFTQSKGTDWLIWFIRESATAMIVSSLPILSTPIRGAATFVRDFSTRTFSSTTSASLIHKISPTPETEEDRATVRSDFTTLTTLKTSIEEGSCLKRQDTVISLETPKDKEGVKLVAAWDSRLENVREIQWIAPWTSEENEGMEQGDSYFASKV